MRNRRCSPRRDIWTVCAPSPGSAASRCTFDVLDTPK
jgi:hypothetical protein